MTTRKAGLKGNPASLGNFGKQLAKVSTVLAQRTAQDAAPALTKLATNAYDRGHTAYGEQRPLGVDGDALDLVQTGAARADLRFAPTGTVVRCTLGPSYTRYLIGKYDILPNRVLPLTWGREIANIARQHFGDALEVRK